ncbi:MAG: NAD(P)/FAD-dependent oxidoreductase [Pirellulales bacterium]|nr:NAD(P)/FAD-dependent oxidoreductase [Pirellulales bacterium]
MQYPGAGHHVVIVGGGFGGLYAAKQLRRSQALITLLDRRNFHLFQPLLYQVATGGLSPANIAAPLRSVLKRQSNTRVLLGEVVDFDVEQRRVILNDGSLPYDTLIVAAGARHHYFGHPEWEAAAPGLKTIEDATEMRCRVFIAFEAAERESDEDLRQAAMTFVVIGAGPTGVELAGAIGELAHQTLRRDFRHIDTSQAKILLLEAGPRVLSTYPEVLSARALDSLQRLGVDVQTDARVTAIEPDRVVYERGGQSITLFTRTVFWAAGVQASPLGERLHQRARAPLDRAGRVVVEANLTVPGHPEIFVIGDLASYRHQGDHPLPGVAPVAMQQGRFVARQINDRLRGLTPQARFVYHDRGNMATIGRAQAVADFGRVRLSGFLAWLAWLFVHIMFLIQFQNRVLVLVQWAANYVTRARSARLITGEHVLPPHLALPAGDDGDGAAARATAVRM